MTKRFAFFALLLMTLALLACAQAKTIEEVEPIRVSNGLVVMDYGFAAADSSGRIQDVYGCHLEKDEQDEMKAMGYQPCFYCSVLNDTDKQQNVRYYIRSTGKHSVYWSKRSKVAAHDQEYQFFGGRKQDKPSKYSGGWSLDFTGKKADIVRIELTMD